MRSSYWMLMTHFASKARFRYGILQSSILDEVAPIRYFPRSRKKPTWVDKDTRGLMRLRTSMARKLRTGTPNNDDFELIKRLKRCIKSRIRASIKNQGTKRMSADDPKATWKFIR